MRPERTRGDFSVAPTWSFQNLDGVLDVVARSTIDSCRRSHFDCQPFGLRLGLSQLLLLSAVVARGLVLRLIHSGSVFGAFVRSPDFDFILQFNSLLAFDALANFFC